MTSLSFRPSTHVKRSTVSLWTVLAHAVTLAAASVTSAVNAAQQPNVVIILADDLGYGDLGCYGSKTTQTPYIDGLAAAGAKLLQFNVPTPYCAPTRASLMTGRYPFRCGMNHNPAPDAGPKYDGIHLPDSEVTLAQLFKQAGYATSIIGKWHLGHAQPEWLPTSRGFDEYFGIPYSNDMRPVQVLSGTERFESPAVQATLTERYTARAVDFIEKNRARPFFLYFPQMHPHKPLAPSEKFYKKPGGLYSNVVAELDWSVGQVLDKLKELQLDEQTLVIFTSDNGPWFGGSTGGLRGMKASSYEGGYRVPCIARWTGKIPAGHVSSQPALMPDLFATTLAAAGIALPADRTFDGLDIMPLLVSDASSPHEYTFGQHGDKLVVVRDARWKLHVLAPNIGPANLATPGQHWIDPRGPDGVTILAPYEQPQPTAHPGPVTGDPPKPMQLFDLQSDPAEQHDVSSEHPEIVARLKKAYDAMNEQLVGIANSRAEK